MDLRKILSATILPLSFLACHWGSLNAAEVIYDSNVTTDNGLISDTDLAGITAHFVADNFVLQAGANTITDVHWTGFFLQNQPGIDNFTIQFYAQSPSITGVPVAPPLATYSVGSNVNRTDTGLDIGGSDVFSYAVDIAPLTLTPSTTYFVSIYNDPGPGSEWAWGGHFQTGGPHAAFSNDRALWFRYDGFAADFFLTGIGPVSVPAPGALLLTVLGLAGLGFSRRERISS